MELYACDTHSTNKQVSNNNNAHSLKITDTCKLIKFDNNKVKRKIVS